jgi:hypothetical protein
MLLLEVPFSCCRVSFPCVRVDISPSYCFYLGASKCLVNEILGSLLVARSSTRARAP